MNTENTSGDFNADDIMQMTTEIVSSFVANNPLPSDSLPDLIISVHKTMVSLTSPEPDRSVERPKPAVPISRSITDDHIICLEDGKKLKMLKRYLRSHYGMTPEEYRKRWGLPADYPMVAPSYTKKRSDFAKQIGLGRASGRRG